MHHKEPQMMAAMHLTICLHLTSEIPLTRSICLVFLTNPKSSMEWAFQANYMWLDLKCGKKFSFMTAVVLKLL